MHICSIKSFPGKNIHSHKTLIKMLLDIGEYYKNPTKDIEGFNERLLELFPGLCSHHCSLGYEGGFKDRLAEGTYIGHVIEHLALELQNIVGYQVFYGKTRCAHEPSLYSVFFQYVNEKTGMEAGRASVEIISYLAQGRKLDVDTIIANLKKISIESDLGP
ncbi:MAG TPA: cyanophycin synthetase, partial [Clostridia bacterium]|nr:cyanophycin synthetase [Clostridia bacterium]